MSESPSMTSSFTKYFCVEEGKYYYHDGVSGLSTWDKPVTVEDMPIHRSVLQLHETKTALKNKNRIKCVTDSKRKEIFDEFYRERAEELYIERKETNMIEFNRIQSFWKTALFNASEQKGQLELSWNKELLFIG